MGDTIQGTCWHCGGALSAHEYGRETNCIACGKPTRVCRNCRWYMRGVANDCREQAAEPVLEKERANYCEFFEPSEDAGEGAAAPAENEQLKKAEDLFNL